MNLIFGCEPSLWWLSQLSSPKIYIWSWRFLYRRQLITIASWLKSSLSAAPLTLPHSSQDVFNGYLVVLILMAKIIKQD